MFDQTKIPLVVIVINLIIGTTTAIVWEVCSDENLQAANAQCGFVSVPLNYKRPRGQQLRIGVTRILHTSSKAMYQGVMLIKVGGVVGLPAVLRRQRFPSAIAATYDWISFDERGAGVSGPNLSCIPDFYPAPPFSEVPTTDALEEHWLNRSKRYIEECVKKHGSVLPHISSANTARDMERIRQAIGAEKFHIYSIAAGTYVSQLYATLYPNRVGKLIMDSPWNWKRVWYDRFLDTDKGIERLVNVWLDWVAQHDNVYHLGSQPCEVRELWNDALRRVAKNPPGGVIGPMEWMDLLGYVYVGQKYWTFITPILAAYMKNNNGTPAVEISTWSTDEEEAVTLASVCNDKQWPKNWDRVKTDLWRTYSTAPLATWYQAWHSVPCIYWPYQSEKPIHVNGSQIGDILMIFETLAIGYREENIRYVRDIFPRARFISVENGVSSSNSLTGNTCVDDVILAYVRNGTIPARQTDVVADVVCAGPPLPIP